MSLGRRTVQILARAKGTDEAITGVLRELAVASGWSMGILWLHDPRSGLLTFGGSWEEEAGLDELRRICERLSFGPSVGLPGTVFASLEPAWVRDTAGVAPDADGGAFPRAEVVLQVGLRAVVAVPVIAGDGPLGVMEFFGRKAGQPRTEQLDAAVVVGQQLAQFVGRAKVEARLRASEESSSSIFRAALDCIFMMDHRGRVLDVNPAAEAVFGYERDAAIGERLADLIVPPDLRDAHHRALAQYVETGVATILNRRLELVGMRADGSTLPVELTVTRLGAREPPVFAGFIRDITLRRDADEQMQRVVDREREARLAAEAAGDVARRAAQALQRSLLPPALPDVPGLELGAVYRAGAQGWEVGGDFYDVFRLSRDEWGFVIGDVVGKGLEAAAITGRVRYEVRAAAAAEDDASAVLAALNDALVSAGGAASVCTAIYARVDLRGPRPRMRIAAAGHPLPLLLDAGGSVRPIGRPGTLLGAVREAVTHTTELELSPGDTLFLYTDGITEARTREGFFGPDRLTRLLAATTAATAQGVADEVESAVIEASGGRATDDIAILAMRA